MNTQPLDKLEEYKFTIKINNIQEKNISFTKTFTVTTYNNIFEVDGLPKDHLQIFPDNNKLRCSLINNNTNWKLINNSRLE